MVSNVASVYGEQRRELLLNSVSGFSREDRVNTQFGSVRATPKSLLSTTAFAHADSIVGGSILCFVSNSESHF